MPDPIYIEKPRSRGGLLDANGRSMTRLGTVLFTSDEDEVIELALANNPQTYRGMLRKSIRPEPIYKDFWDVTIEYGIGKPSGLSPDNFSIKIGTQSVHINQGKETIFALSANPTVSGTDLAANDLQVTPDGYEPADTDEGKRLIVTGGDGFTIGMYVIAEVVSGPGGTWTLDRAPADAPVAGGGSWYLTEAPDHQGAIGVAEDSVNGCDILVPKMEWSKTVQRSDLSFEYLLTLFNLVGKTNDAPFYSFPAGTLLYLGAEPTTSQAALSDGTEFTVWTLCHQFAYEPSVTDQTIGDIVVPRKRGWEYLWSLFGYDPQTRGLGRKPKAVYVERTYDEGNFELLEIGTGEGGEE